MGSRESPWEAYVLQATRTYLWVVPLIRRKCMFYMRYIDDIFLIWQVTEEDLKGFFKAINNLHSTIDFEPNNSIQGIKLRDTVVYKTKIANEGLSQTTDVYSQALRIKRICSEEREMRKQFLKKNC